MGLRRSLSTEEILEQVRGAMLISRRHQMPPLRNVVFMGMGEPLDNPDAVISALQAMTHPHGFALARQHLCVSTVAPSPEAVMRMVEMPARLAWSVHAASDELRRLLVPTTQHSMEELADAFAHVLRARNDRGLMVELALIDGVNDGLEHAEQLLQLLDRLPGKTRVNVIPYNPNEGLGAAGSLFQPSTDEAVRNFQRYVISRGTVCTVRTTRGQGESAACGQLATKRLRSTQG
tara:strand:+ start:164 stop:865 length:702 start_codon:yes stop_codon:yes gene_type:complete